MAESIYNSTEKPSHLSSYFLQGAPMTTTNPVFVNRTSVPVTLENQTMIESTNVRNWNSQVGSHIPKMNF